MSPVDITIFSFWCGADDAPIGAFVAEWNAAFPTFRVLRDRDVEPLILKHASAAELALYRSINIPAAKSDLARLVALLEYGGLYVDCHIGLVDANGVRQLAQALQTYELIVWDLSRAEDPRPNGKIIPINSCLCARPSSPIVKAIADCAFANLRRQRDNEAVNGFVPYHIGELSGPHVIENVIIEPESGDRTRLRSVYEGRIGVISENFSPIQRNVHRHYTTPENHWSERQKRELLFSRPAGA